MFKNPLKYQQGGGTASAQQQEQLVQLFQAAAQNAQVDPEALVQKAQEFGQDEQAAAQFMEGLQRCAQGDPAGIKFIQDLFKQPAYKEGGKIHNFICKHGRGGIAGCGCNKVEKGATGMSMGDALTGAMNTHGFNRNQARMAYSNAKSALRNQGLRGSELRQRAREMLINQPAETAAQKIAVAEYAPKEVALSDFDYNIPIEDDVFEAPNTFVKVYNSGNFNNAFADARRNYLENGGPDIFYWNKDIYNTNLDNTVPTNITPRSREEIAQTNQNTAMVQPGGGNTSWMWNAFDRVFGKHEDGGNIESAKNGTTFNFQSLTQTVPDIYNTGGYVNMGRGIYGRFYRNPELRDVSFSNNDILNMQKAGISNSGIKFFDSANKSLGLKFQPGTWKAINYHIKLPKSKLNLK